MNNVISVVNRQQAQLVEDKWQMLNVFAEHHTPQDATPLDHLVIPFKPWLAAYNSGLLQADFENIQAFSIDNSSDVNELKPWLNQLKLIVLDFPKFTDGRAYTQAVELRRHLGWQGELRANGDVLRDQLSHMLRCGFDSFAIREDKDRNEALKGLTGISVLYANSVLEPQPLFRRRAL